MRPQIEMMRRGIAAELDAGDRHLKTDARPFESRLEVRREPVQRDRPVHQAPEHKADEQDQDGGKGAEPSQEMVRPPPDAPGRALMHDPAPTPGPPVLTGFERRARVPRGAGVGRWAGYWAP